MEFWRGKEERRKKDMPEEKVEVQQQPIGLGDYFKACYPLIYVRTSEDYRAVHYIREAVEKAGLSECWIGEWKVNTGLVIDGTQKGDCYTVAKALQHVATTQEPGVLIVHNIRQFISNFLVIQELKDAAMVCRVLGSYIVLVGASVEFPPEIRDFVTIYDFALPDREYFTQAYGRIIQEYKQGLTLPESVSPLLGKAAEAALGMTEIQGENALALSMVRTKGIDIPTIYEEKKQAIRQSDVLELVDCMEEEDNLGGFDQFKPWLLRRKNTFDQKARDYGLCAPRGILLVGVSGAGKSLCCKVIASCFQVPLLRFDVGKVFKSLQGLTEEATRNALKVAEAVAPCVLWIEELEKSMAGSESSGRTDSGTTARVMQTILTWMQEKTAPVFLSATANAVDRLPPELLRKGRFDEIWGVDLPSPEERDAIFQIHIRKRKRDPANYDIVALVKATEWFSGAEIEVGIEDAMFSAYNEKAREFTTEDILSSIKATVPLSQSQPEKIAEIREWIAQKTRLVSSYKPRRWMSPGHLSAAESSKKTRKVRTQKLKEGEESRGAGDSSPKNKL